MIVEIINVAGIILESHKNVTHAQYGEIMRRYDNYIAIDIRITYTKNCLLKDRSLQTMEAIRTTVKER